MGAAMTGSVPAELVALAHRLADAARPIVSKHFRTAVVIDDKSDASPVTIADRDAETAMRTLLTKHVPEHGVFGEEHGAVRTVMNDSALENQCAGNRTVGSNPTLSANKPQHPQ